MYNNGGQHERTSSFSMKTETLAFPFPYPCLVPGPDLSLVPMKFTLTSSLEWLTIAFTDLLSHHELRHQSMYTSYSSFCLTYIIKHVIHIYCENWHACMPRSFIRQHSHDNHLKQIFVRWISLGELVGIINLASIASLFQLQVLVVC